MDQVPNFLDYSDTFAMWKASIPGMLHYAKWQALGFAVSDNSLLARYRIEGVGIMGYTTADGARQVGLHHISYILESSVRTFSNLLERLHHSFWFYFIPLPGRFSLLSFYIGPVALLSAALLFKGLKYWWIGETGTPLAASVLVQTPIVLEESITKRINIALYGDSDGEDNGKSIKKSKKKRPTKYFVVPASQNERFSRERRELFRPVIIVLMAHVAGLFAMRIPHALLMSGENFIIVSTILSLIFGKLAIPKLVNIIASPNSFSAIRKQKESALLNSLICTELGLGLCSISTLNPSLSLALAIPSVPVLLSLDKSSKMMLDLLLVLLYPCVLLSAGIYIWGVIVHGDVAGQLAIESVGRLVDRAIFESGMHGAWLYPVSCWFQSCVIAAQVLRSQK